MCPGSHLSFVDSDALKPAPLLGSGPSDPTQSRISHLSQIIRRPTLANPAVTRRYLASRLRHLRYEVFACLFLDSQHRPIAFAELFRGTIDGASVYPREVLAECLRHNAAAVILAHNHPSGVAEPSLADRQITRRLVDSLALVDIRVLDHIVVGDGEAVSFAERGLL